MRLQQLLSSRGCPAFLTSSGSEEGTTLIELLVAIVAGIAILGALFTIEATVLHQTTRGFSKISATSHARVGMEQIENELHSACVADNVTPILSGSTSSTLMFVSEYGAWASAPSGAPVEHVVTYNSSAGTLTDTAYAETGETLNSNDQPVYTFATTPTSSRVVLNNVIQTKVAGVAQPVFQYFAYQTVTNPSTSATYDAPDGNPYEMLVDGTNEVPGTSYIPAANPLTSPLSTAQADVTAEVMIMLTVGPAGGSGEITSTTGFEGANFSDTFDQVQDGIVLRLTPAPNEDSTGAVFLPCQ